MYINKNAQFLKRPVEGFGKSSFLKLKKEVGINLHKNPAFLKVNQKKNAKKLYTIFSISSNIKKKVFDDIVFLKELRCFRGIRHTKKLPCRGQRTRTNSRMARVRR